jgi:hypothetical protein
MSDDPKPREPRWPFYLIGICVVVELLIIIVILKSAS